MLMVNFLRDIFGKRFENKVAAYRVNKLSQMLLFFYSYLYIKGRNLFEVREHYPGERSFLFHAKVTRTCKCAKDETLIDTTRSLHADGKKASIKECNLQAIGIGDAAKSTERYVLKVALANSRINRRSSDKTGYLLRDAPLASLLMPETLLRSVPNPILLPFPAGFSVMSLYSPYNSYL